MANSGHDSEENDVGEVEVGGGVGVIEIELVKEEIVGMEFDKVELVGIELDEVELVEIELDFIAKSIDMIAPQESVRAYLQVTCLTRIPSLLNL